MTATRDPGVPVFTPDNEPYLGRDGVRKFDAAIVRCLKTNQVLAQRTRQANLSELQIAATQIIPQGIKLALSIRELVRQAYLFAGAVLMRPLMERTTIILYLELRPEGLGIWTNGWKYRERPGLPAMLAEIGEHRFQHVEINPAFTREYNSLSHGDPSSAAINLGFTEHGEPIFGVSKDLEDPELCDRVCSEATVWLAQLILAGSRIFPERPAE